MSKTEEPQPIPPDFALMLGGPLFQILRRSHLAGDALELLSRRILVITAIAWLPLPLLAMLDGRLLPDSAGLPLLYDAGSNVRFLVVIPLLILAEIVVHARMVPIVREFLARDLVPERERGKFLDAVESALRLRNSVVVELVMIAAVYVGIAVSARPFYASFTTDPWYMVRTATGVRFTAAGEWACWVSLPIFQFILLRWYFRIFVWSRFLFRVSRLDLSLVPTHPDRVGGLGFLANVSYAFIPLAAAHGVLLSGMIANRIFHMDRHLVQFKVEIAVVVLLVLLLAFGPLCLLAGLLARKRREGLRDYGRLANRYVKEFHAKWVTGEAPTDESLVGSGDVQSLADMGGSFDIVREMKFAPVTRQAAVQLAFAVLLPLAPLLLTIMPLDELIGKLFGMVL